MRRSGGRGAAHCRDASPGTMLAEEGHGRAAMILRVVDPASASAVIGVLLALGLAEAVLALPPVRSRPRASQDAAAGVAEETVGDDADRDRVGGEEPATDDAPAPAPKRRPGAKQIEEPEALDEELEDPDAARRAQFFGGMPGFPMPGMPMPGKIMPGFPGGVFPFAPPGAGDAAGAVAGDVQGFGVRQFGFSGVVVGGNAMPGGNGFVIRTWQIGPDGAVVEVPPAEPQVPQPGRQARAAKPKAPADRALGNARRPAPRDAAAKARRPPRAKTPAPPPKATDAE